jgi:predicted secreted protein
VRRWWVVIALLLSVGVNVGLVAAIVAGRWRAPAAAQERQPPPVARLQRLADRLGLEGDARRRFVAYQRSFFQDTARDRRRLAEVNRELREELLSASPDPQRIDRLTAESSGLYQTIERALAGNVLATRKLLDPDQERIYLRLIRQLRPGRGPLAPPAAPWRRGLDGPPPQPQPPPAAEP